MDAEEREKMLHKIADDARSMAKETDFERLEADGILTKEGAWYRVHNFDELPTGTQARVSEIQQDSKGIKVKFSKSSKFDKLSKKLDRLIKE
ncbi:hypothetical protein T5B8_18868 [Salinisphaera sp. T5B8]|uniref:hypothetical protein n=1 Tax=Salinisphaera sp. T5B8 TaxID=1304154 RepID=UPI00333FA565